MQLEHRNSSWRTAKRIQNMNNNLNIDNGPSSVDGKDQAEKQAPVAADHGIGTESDGSGKRLKEFGIGKCQADSAIPAIPLQPSDLSQFRIRTQASECTIDLPPKARIGKPKPAEWFASFPPNEKFEVAVFIPADGDKDFPYLVTPEIAEMMPDVCKKVMPVVWTTPNGAWGVWNLGIPDPVWRNGWVDSAWSAALQAEKQWRRIASNKAQGQYIISMPVTPLPMPDRPGEDWLNAQIMGAFEGRIIGSPDHPAFQAYQMNSK